MKLHVVLTRDSLVNKGRKERNLKSQKANTEPLYTEVINTAYEDINCVLSFIWLDDGAQTPKSNLSSDVETHRSTIEKTTTKEHREGWRE